MDKISRNPQKLATSGSYLVAVGAALWSLDAIFRTRLIGTYSAYFIVFITQIICLVVVVPVLWKFRSEILRLKIRDWLAFLFIAVASNVLAMVAFTYAFSLASNFSVPILIQKVQPFFAIVSAVLILKERLPKYYFLYVLIAVVGSFLVAFGDGTDFSVGSKDFVVVIFSLVAAALWGLGTTAGRFLSVHHSFWLVTSMRYGIGATLMIILFPIWSAELIHVQEHLIKDMPQFLAMALIPGLLALFIYYRGLQSTRASVACWLELFYPVTAVVINWAFLGSSLSTFQVIGAIVLLVSVLAMNFSSLQKTGN